MPSEPTTIWTVLGLIVTSILGGGLLAKKTGISITLSRTPEKQGDKTMPETNGRRALASTEAIKLLDRKQDIKYCEAIHGQVCKDLEEIKDTLRKLKGTASLVKALADHFKVS